MQGKEAKVTHDFQMNMEQTRSQRSYTKRPLSNIKKDDGETNF
jgi:hypothetical protein